ncbi:NUDIX hydrolase [Candidatus Saccharibacteria bacterium]|nr:NUDIX hydrolase [Candidatus Saccharibacteria bacterium]
MKKAARALIFNGDTMLVMERNKHGSQYITLVGGRVDSEETVEQALIREVKEETGLVVTSQKLVFIEEHPEPYNQQYIYLCTVESMKDVAIQPYAEESLMNRIDLNTHRPVWVNVSSLANLPFRTPQLLQAIISSLKNGFPERPVKL